MVKSDTKLVFHVDKMLFKKDINFVRKLRISREGIIKIDIQMGNKIHFLFT